MNVAQALPLADTWGAPGGWWIVMCVVMMVCMVAMMFGMARIGTGAERRRPAPWERFMARETPAEILDRRFAEGAISLDDYEQHKQQLAERDPRQTEPSDAEPGSHLGRAPQRWHRSRGRAATVDLDAPARHYRSASSSRDSLTEGNPSRMSARDRGLRLAGDARWSRDPSGRLISRTGSPFT